MLSQLLRKLKRSYRNWNTDPTRADRNAVIQRIVTAAAAESKEIGALTRVATPPPGPSPLSAHLMGQEPAEPPIPGDLIGQRAQEIWLRNGRPQGTAAADWTQAEAELRAEHRGEP